MTHYSLVIPSEGRLVERNKNGKTRKEIKEMDTRSKTIRI